MDTTRHSTIHYVITLLGKISRGRIPPNAIAYSVSIVLTIVPLFLTAGFEFQPLSLIKPEGLVRLPLLKDWNVIFMLLLTLPLLFTYVSSDERTLIRVLVRIVKNDVLRIRTEQASSLVGLWTYRFSILNKIGQITGFFVAICVAYFNYKAYRNVSVGLWTTKSDGFSLTGYVYLYTIFFFYWVVFMFVLRSIGIIVFLRDLVSKSDIRIVPFHPDRCGGLRPIGILGLRNQYILSVIGFNLFILFYLYTKVLVLPETVYGLMAVAFIMYICLGPIVFIGPLLPFRAVMRREKEALGRLIGRMLRLEWAHIHKNLEHGSIVEEDTVKRLQKLSELVNGFPVWPFDIRTIAKFSSAYFVPVIASLVAPFLVTLVKTYV